MNENFAFVPEFWVDFPNSNGWITIFSPFRSHGLYSVRDTIAHSSVRYAMPLAAFSYDYFRLFAQPQADLGINDGTLLFRHFFDSQAQFEKV
jgi:hypothetical protein